MTELPPLEVLNALNAPTTRITRRVEIYEQDGMTRWQGDTDVRLIDGSISIDYSRDERRALDIVLDNADGNLVNAPGHFWYDKIIKCFRGVEVRQGQRPPRIIIVAGGEQNIIDFRGALVGLGFGDVRINPLAADLLDLDGYEIVVSLGGDGAPLNGALLRSAYDAGFSIFTQGPVLGPTGAQLPFVAGTQKAVTGGNWHIEPTRSRAHELTSGWQQDTWPRSGTFALPVEIATSAWVVSADPASNTYSIIAAENANGRGGKWVDLHTPFRLSAQVRDFTKAAFGWLNPFVPMSHWEVQVGEFMIDKISEAHFPRHMKVTGRDYTKRCLTSKFERATQFDGPNQLEYLISSISANAGITKKVLPITGVTVNKTFFFERGTPRWEAMKDIANAYNYDIYFDGQGYLRLDPQSDPAQSTPAFAFETGRYGNLASYEKSTNDARLYNHVIVTGGSEDEYTLPPFGEAKNTDPNSPTSIAEIGDRLYQYESQFINTDAQAQAVANQFLAVHSLEVFELNFEAIVFFWLDVGVIIRWIDPRPAPGDPDMFLLTALNIPMQLGPMSGTGARVTLI